MGWGGGTSSLSRERTGEGGGSEQLHRVGSRGSDQSRVGGDARVVAFVRVPASQQANPSVSGPVSRCV